MKKINLLIAALAGRMAAVLVVSIALLHVVSIWMYYVATEAMFLFARYAFDRLGYRRFEWKCHNDNQPSKRAALRFGFLFEGLFRQHMVAKGKNRDTAWFAIIDQDWPRLKAGYEVWLQPENFDAAGQQRRKLTF